ncbi:allantoate deiminase [Brevibacillus laterosporus]|uniref:allantoate deiminase n=1 Tax=Brevibacillus laterosporus TaxID=1465 RepID=UPI000CE5687D|nr:allantoate deiminase [Brevibacillus laterosporus]MED1664875.1 allantoate deiminase [Brevibacillus laterosporus]MED1671457.1 allantoate deiminase [Brevibacillus laterosporus]MED1717514.1 allantoate deiminase [Brevibacillus laterosporus]PPA87611.1 allantoate amidohydrolase [Brevibacillus laterosporus]
MGELSKEIVQHLEWLGHFGKEPEGGISRFLYSKEWLEAQKALEDWMNKEGFDFHFDEVGNLFGGLQGTKYQDETVLTGSHVDTVGNGGLYDGQYGIIAGLLAIKYLKEKYGNPLRNLQVVSMAEEEGSRFPYAFWGSKNIVCTAKREEVENIADFDGIAFVDAMRECGFDFRKESTELRKDLKTFVEIHIEQGSVLENEKKSVGVVHSIVGQRRFTVEVTGEANHAGTTPMGYRKDTVHAASTMICDVMNRTKKHGDPLVATVGKIEVKPNVVNVVPGYTLFTMDIRHTEKKALVQFTEEIMASMNAIAEEMGVGLKVDMWMDADPVPMDKRVVEVIESQCKENGLNYKLMHSGAGHDAQILAPFVPSAMIFVPSRKGISHNPAEYTEPHDLAEGVKALIGTLYELAYKE